MTLTEIFLFAFNAVMPIVLLIVTGYFLRRIKLLNDTFMETANKFVFNVSLPVLLFFNVYNIKNLGEIEWSTVIFSVTVIILIFIAGFVYSFFFVKDNKQKGVVWQSFFRSNYAIIGIPLSEAIGGAHGVASTSVLSAFAIPMFNALAVISLSVFSSDGKNKISVKDILLRVIKNPLIIGVFSGLAALGIRSLIPEGGFSIKNDMPFLYDAIEMLGGIASPLALVVMGGQFRFDAVKSLKKQIIAGTVARNIFTPTLGLGLAVLLSSKTEYFNFAPAHFASFVTLFASPVAVSSAIMASQMDGDEQLANQILVWTSIFSIFTLFIIIALLKYAALI